MEEDNLFSVWCASITWKPASFDSIVKSVADEENFGVSIVSRSSGNIYCPYDGGADIFSF